MTPRAHLAALVGTAALLGAAGCATPLQRAIVSDDPARVRAAVGSGADVNERYLAPNVNAAGYACLKGKPNALKALVEEGADLSEHDDVYASPLYWCSRFGRGDMVRFLIERGARMSATLWQTSGETIRADYPEIHRLLQDAVKRSVAATPHIEPRASPGNLDDDAYGRMRAAAGMPPERRGPVSDVDSPPVRGAERPDDFALVIGVEEYQALPKADHGVRDAKTVRRHLEALGFPARNIVSLEGSGATKSKLESYLKEWLPLNVTPSSTLFVYYSGHGAPDPRSGDAYLVPWDGDPKFLKSTAYPLKALYEDLSKTKAKRVIVALDACFSGAGGRSVLAQGARPLVAKVDDGVPAATRLTVLAAASGDEITGTLEEQGHGLFTYHLLKGLSADPKASAKSLHGYLLPRVQDDARRQNREQTPTLAGGSLDAPLLP